MKQPATSSRWIYAGVVVTFSASLFQVSFIRVLSYVFPFQMIFAISLVAGAAIFFSGIGALIASRMRRFTPVAVATALTGPASLYAVSLFTTRSMTDFASFGAAVAICAVPFTLYGLLNGICYRAVHDAERRAVALLIGFSAIAFFAGLTGAAFLSGIIGVVTLAVLAAVALSALFLPPMAGGALIFLLATLFTLFDLESRLFPLIAREPALWGKFGRTAQVVGGGWSPYARVDLVDIGDDRLAGLYNGVQYWMTGAPRHDVAFRRSLYNAVTGSVLVIGTGGGHGLLSLTKASRIEAVELDPLVIELFKGPLARYNNDIYNTIAVAHAGDGRSYLDNSPGNYDAIILEAAEVGLSNYHRSFISLENYLYTREAMASAFRKLSPTGILIVIHTDRYVPRERFIKAFPGSALFRTFQATSLIPGTAGMRFTTDITIAASSPDTLDRWAAVVAGADPDIVDETETVLASERFKTATAISDDRPTLYLEQYSQLIPFVAAAALLLLAALMLGIRRDGGLGLFFFSLGISFMFTELYLINMLRSAVNGYVETSAIALGAHTLGTAAGAAAAGRVAVRTALRALVPSFILLFLAVSFFPFGAPTAVKILVILIAVLPVSFVTGTFFPRGFFLASNDTVPRYYAVDTIASAGAFLLFYLITAVAGFPVAGLFALAGYLIAGFLLMKAGR